MILGVINPMGAGKTLLAAIWALHYSQKHPNNSIFSNFTLNLKNAEKIKGMVLPLSRLKDCLLIFDDFYALENSDGLVATIVNLSRKKNITVIITCQYYTMIQKKIRDLCIIAKTQFMEHADAIKIDFYRQEKFFKRKYVKNVIRTAKAYELYDTKEIIRKLTRSQLIEAIVECSVDFVDLEENVENCFKNKRERLKILKEIMSDYPKYGKSLLEIRNNQIKKNKK